MRRRYAFRNGEIVEVGGESQESASAYVHDDSFKKPLRHPKTGEMVDSASRWNAINREHNLKVVGNDYKPGAGPTVPKDKITNEIIMDRMQRAEAILSDPAKARARVNENIARLERYYQRRNEVMGVRRIRD